MRLAGTDDKRVLYSRVTWPKPSTFHGPLIGRLFVGRADQGRRNSVGLALKRVGAEEFRFGGTSADEAGEGLAGGVGPEGELGGGGGEVA